MNSIRVIKVDILFGEEDERSTHEDVHSTLRPRIVYEIVANEERELTQEFCQGSGVKFLEISVGVLLLDSEDVGRSLLGKDSPVVFEDGHTFDWEVKPL